MRKLPKPTDDPVQVFRACISIVRDPALKGRLESVEVSIENAAIEYDNKATTTELHNFPQHENVAGVVKKEEMKAVYKSRMATQGRPGRPLYDRLKAAPANGRCPLCGWRVVSTLDHYLPQDHYPSLTVTPVNLIPACADCNKEKGAATPQADTELILHPYYDDVEDDPWLFAEVIEDSPAALRFFVNPPDAWDKVMAQRIRYHFNVFKLSPLYASHAAEELSNIRYALDKLFAQAGIDGVVDYLQSQEETYEAACINSWQTAMYKALAASDWFCEGGFQL